MRLTLICLICLFVCNKCFASNADTVINIIKNNSDDATISIGTLSMRNTPVYASINGVQTGRMIVIDSVFISIKDGSIVNILVYSANGEIFTNGEAPIAATDDRVRKGDMLVSDRDDEVCVSISDIISYPQRDAKNIMPDDTSFTISKISPNAILHKGVGINTVFDIRVYTDALGLLGGQSNGLVQTDANFKQYINTTNWPNNPAFFFHYFKINFTASKFDSKDKYEALDTATFSRSHLTQKTWLNASVEFNIFDVYLSNKSLNNFYIDGGAGLGISEVTKGTDTGSVICPHFMAEAGFNFKPANNIGCNIGARFIYQYSPQTDFSAMTTDDDPRAFYKGFAMVFWNPYGSKSSRIYARAVYTFNFNPMDKKNSFLQLQFGYSVLLSKLVKK